MTRYYTAAEAARKLHVSKETVYHWLKAGKLHGDLVGFAWQIREDVLKVFLQARSRQSTMATSAPARFFTPTDLARELQVTRGTVYSWLKAGKLRGHQISGAQWAVSEEDLEAFLQTHSWLARHPKKQ